MARLKRKKYNNTGIFTYEECEKVLAKTAKGLVYNIVKKYENGPLSSIFNEEEMTALAEDKMLITLRGIKLFEEKGKIKGAVEHLGAVRYFKTSFFNHSQKIYEKYARTDIRAGVKTYSGADAQSLAASRNTIHPENAIIIKKEVENILEEIKLRDEEANRKLIALAIENKERVEPEDLQKCHLIMDMILQGYEAREIKKKLNLTTSQYANQRKTAFSLARKSLPYTFDEIRPFFSQKTDNRIYRRDVKKRKRHIEKIDFKVQKKFFVESSIDGDNWENTLCLRMTVLDGDEPFRKVKPKTVPIKTISSTEKEASNIRRSLLKDSEHIITDKEQTQFVNEVMATA